MTCAKRSIVLCVLNGCGWKKRAAGAAASSNGLIDGEPRRCYYSAKIETSETISWREMVPHGAAARECHEPCTVGSFQEWTRSLRPHRSRSRRGGTDPRRNPSKPLC